jgi:nitrogen fixation/metabolism regulation signal transduction histidine kinase
VLAEGVFYALVASSRAAAGAGFVLARNLLKLWVERRQAAPFARFRAKLVAALLAMSIIPAVLVLISGSSIINNSTALWFNDSVTDVLSAAQTIASHWYQEHQETIGLRAEQPAARLPAAEIVANDARWIHRPRRDRHAARRRDRGH